MLLSEAPAEGAIKKFLSPPSRVSQVLEPLNPAMLSVQPVVSVTAP